MLTAPRNTVAYQTARAINYRRTYDGLYADYARDLLRRVPLFLSYAAREAYENTPAPKASGLPKEVPHFSPPDDALWFYLLTHLTGEIAKRRHPLEPLSDAEMSLFEMYHAVIGPMFIRMFDYIFMICMRETRHANSAYRDRIVPRYGKEMAEFWFDFRHSFEGDGDRRMYQSVKSAIDGSYPTLTLRQMLAFAVQIFEDIDHAGWGGSYGGRPWQRITETLARCADGMVSPTVMLDNVWTLEHNTGHIFNKGMVYTYPEKHLMRRILDIQAGGFIPAALVSLADPATMPAWLTPLQIEKVATPELIRVAEIGFSLFGDMPRKVDVDLCSKLAVKWKSTGEDEDAEASDDDEADDHDDTPTLATILAAQSDAAVFYPGVAIPLSGRNAEASFVLGGIDDDAVVKHATPPKAPYISWQTPADPTSKAMSPHGN